MRESCTHQPLTDDVRLPDEAQADALRKERLDDGDLMAPTLGEG
jgi:hypothetical protein